jgi:CHASE3 domain sensor protein
MKWFKELQANTITFSICFILFLIAGNGILDFSNRQVKNSHDQLMDEAMELEVAMTTVLRALNNSDMGFRGYYIIPTQQLLHPYTEAVGSFPSNIQRVKQIMIRQGLDPIKIQPVEQSFYNYFNLIGELVEWRKQENFAAVDSVIAKDPGFAVWEVYKGFKDELDIDMKTIISESQAKTDKIMMISTSVRIILFALGIPTLLIVLFRLRREKRRRMQLFHELDQNNRKYLFNPNEKVEDSKLNADQIIDSLIKNLRKASGFISNIAKGNFDVKWEGLHEGNREANKENLAGELLQMREQMLKVKEEDKIRLWATEGVSKFAELVRQNQDDIKVLADRITSEVVKYLGANQASLFFAEDKGNSEIVLELYGCYAYDRKKHLNKTIDPGEGLVGQVYLEKEITYITDIPQNYVRITSGLGQATPGSLVITPLKFNERVEGVLEIASFKKFHQHEFDFLIKIGEILASAIVTSRSSSEMKVLMENLQAQSEEMKAQEEEMRQNMEELQATQEEMHRKANESQQIISAHEASLKEKAQEIKNLQNHIKTLEA